MDLDALRKTAEEAPQGMWQASFDGSKITAFGGSSEGTATRWRIMCAYDPAAGRHAATFDPPTVLVLLDTAARAESAEAENARLRAQVAEVAARVVRAEALLAAWEHDAPGLVDPTFAGRLRETLRRKPAPIRTRAALASPTSHAQQEAEVVCDHPGIDHSPWSYCGVCPACGVCKFIGHGPLCIDCYATRARTTEEPS